MDHLFVLKQYLKSRVFPRSGSHINFWRISTCILLLYMVTLNEIRIWIYIHSCTFYILIYWLQKHNYRVPFAVFVIVVFALQFQDTILFFSAGKKFIRHDELL